MKRKKGFTLIELMIAVAIVAFLAAVALPSYQGQLRKGRRATAQAFMMDVVQREQARFLDTRSYVTVASNAEFDDADKLRMPIPDDVSRYYNVSVALIAGPPPGFNVTAVATGSQDHKNQEDLLLCSNTCPGVNYNKARGDAASSTWDPEKW